MNSYRFEISNLRENKFCSHEVFISAAFQNDPIFWCTWVGSSFRVVFTCILSPEMKSIPALSFKHGWLCDLYWLDVFLLLEIISNFISLLNYKYQFVSFKFYIGWNSLTWGLPTYILLRLSIRIIGKIAETKLIFFAGKNILYKNTQPRVFFCLFTIYHMIYRHTLNKVHHMWQLLISFKWKINLVYFKINLFFHATISETSQISRWRLTQTQIA